MNLEKRNKIFISLTLFLSMILSFNVAGLSNGKEEKETENKLKFINRSLNDANKSEGYHLDIQLIIKDIDDNEETTMSFDVVVVNPDLLFVRFDTEGMKGAFIQKGDKMAFWHQSFDIWQEPDEEEKRENELIKKIKDKIISITDQLEDVKVSEETKDVITFQIKPAASIIFDFLPEEIIIDKESLDFGIALSISKRDYLPSSAKINAKYDMLIKIETPDEEKWNVWDEPEEGTENSVEKDEKKPEYKRQKEELEINIFFSDYNKRLNFKIPEQAKKILGIN